MANRLRQLVGSSLVVLAAGALLASVAYRFLPNPGRIIQWLTTGSGVLVLFFVAVLGILVAVPSAYASIRSFLGHKDGNRLEVSYATFRTQTGKASGRGLSLLYASPRHPRASLPPLPATDRRDTILRAIERGDSEPPLPGEPEEPPGAFDLIGAAYSYWTYIWNTGDAPLQNLEFTIQLQWKGGRVDLGRDGETIQPDSVIAKLVAGGPRVLNLEATDTVTISGLADLLNPKQVLEISFDTTHRNGWGAEPEVNVFTRAPGLPAPIACEFHHSMFALAEETRRDGLPVLKPKEKATRFVKRGRAAFYLGRRIVTVGTRIKAVGMFLAYRKLPVDDEPE